MNILLHTYSAFETLHGVEYFVTYDLLPVMIRGLLCPAIEPEYLMRFEYETLDVSLSCL